MSSPRSPRNDDHPKTDEDRHSIHSDFTDKSLHSSRDGAVDIGKSGKKTAPTGKKQQHDNKNKNNKKKKSKSKEEEMEERLVEGLEEWEKVLREDEKHEREEKERSKKDNERMKTENEQQEKEEEIEQLEKELSKAIEKKHVGRLRKALQNIRDKDHVKTFGKTFEEGELLLRSIERIDKVDKVASKINQSKVSEVHSFGKPAEIVHQVMRATLLVMGHDAQQLKEWPTCQKEIVVMGHNALHQQLAQFDPINLDVNTAVQALAILDNYESRKAYSVCGSAGLFYDWTAGVCEKRVASDDKAANKRKKENQKKKEDAKQEDEKKKKEQEKEAKKNAGKQ